MILIIVRGGVRVEAIRRLNHASKKLEDVLYVC